PEELEICSYSTTLSDALLLLPPSISSTSHVSKKFLIFDFGPFLKEGKLTNRFVFVVFRFKGLTMLKRHKSRLEEMEDAIARCEENSIECIRELRIIKALFVCCFAMVFMYLTYA
ncbi:hypothetical protein HID58_055638, partial [Brassica napus]